jgi:hypothetical protein
MENRELPTTEQQVDSINVTSFDDILLWTDIYLQGTCDALNRYFNLLEHAAERNNIHGVFLNLTFITQQGMLLNKLYRSFHSTNPETQAQKNFYYKHMQDIFRFTHTFLRQTSAILSLFFDLPPLKEIYQTERIDWAAPLIDLAQALCEHLTEMYRHNTQQFNETDFILCIQQQQELMSAREHSSAYALEFE